MEELRKFYEFLFEMENKKIEGFVEKLFNIQMIEINTIF